MYTMNQLTIIGFTGSDADVHYTQNGTLVTTRSVATKESWKDAAGAVTIAHRASVELPSGELSSSLATGASDAHPLFGRQFCRRGLLVVATRTTKGLRGPRRHQFALSKGVTHLYRHMRSYA
jgi:hypothetical protein